MRKFIVKLMYARYALSRINKPHLGDFVKMKSSGQRFVLIQGVASPYFDLHNPTDGLVKRVHKSEFCLIKPFWGRVERFFKSYRFMMGSWFLIDTWNKSLFEKIQYRGS